MDSPTNYETLGGVSIDRMNYSVPFFAFQDGLEGGAFQNYDEETCGGDCLDFIN